MSFFEFPPKPKSALGWHRTFIGDSWSGIFGKNEDPFKLLNVYFALGGNCHEIQGDSEKLIGQWMEERGVWDQTVIATKYTAGYRAYNREKEPLQSNFTGNSAKSMHISDRTTSAEEVMRGLHAHVMAKEVLYLGISDTPAWVVVKANA
ncbi:Norsolorinic acid reductase A, partial [Colletotrichum shisoi]